MSNKFRIPDVVYLQCHDDDGELFDLDGEEVTWCEDDVDGHNIKYVRQDAILTSAMHSDGESRCTCRIVVPKDKTGTIDRNGCPIHRCQ